MTMLTDTTMINYLEKYYAGNLPDDGINFTMSLLSKGRFSPEYKAKCIMQILYLDDSLKPEQITTEGWKAIHCGLESEDDTAYNSMPVISQKQTFSSHLNN
jgi:hypothetical protein